MLRDGVMNKYQNIPCYNLTNPGTIIDFQLNLKKETNLSEAFSSLGGYSDIDFSIEKLMDDNDVVQYDVFDNCKGTATRESGRLIRNSVLNILSRGGQVICLNFQKVEMVSSSFIDEFIAKMVVELGFVRFVHTIRIANMNPTVSYLCDRSVYMRINTMWSDIKATSVSK